MIRAAALLCTVIGCTGRPDCWDDGAPISDWKQLENVTVRCQNLPPLPGTEALTGDGGMCGPKMGDDTCVICAKGSCCGESLGCWGDTACSCLVACRTSGQTTETCSAPDQCGAPHDPPYDTMTSCIHANCAAQCPRLQ